MVMYPTYDNVIEAHDKIIETFGGASGLITEGAVRFILESVAIRFNTGETVKEAAIKKAALLLFELISQHPFVDGNKRTGFVVCEEFLNANGFVFEFGVDEAEKLAIGIASGNAKRSLVEKWVRKRVRPVV